MNEDQITFTGTVRKQGESFYLLLRPEIADYLDVQHMDTMQVQPENGKHGPYISAWNPDQQDN